MDEERHILPSRESRGKCAYSIVRCKKDDVALVGIELVEVVANAAHLGDQFSRGVVLHGRDSFVSVAKL